MIDRFMLWSSSLTMEETFILTWVGAILLGGLLAIPLYWLFERDARNSRHDCNPDANEKTVEEKR